MPPLADDDSPARKCYYLVPGASGLAGLKAIIQYGKRQSASWLSKVQLHICMNNHVDTTGRI